MAESKKPTPTQLATRALESIAKHEAECGMRWKEAHRELKQLSESVKNHAARWERLAWLVIGTVVVSLSATLLKQWF